MSYINATLFFEPLSTKTKYGDKRIMFKAKSRSGGAKAELFPVKLDSLTAREEKTLLKYLSKIKFSATVHIQRKSTKRRKVYKRSRK